MSDRRDQYAADIRDAAEDDRNPFSAYYAEADAAIAKADAEQQVLLTNVREWREDASGWQKLAHKKIEEAARLHVAIKRVRELHKPDEGYPPECRGCFDPYPCATVRALDA